MRLIHVTSVMIKKMKELRSQKSTYLLYFYTFYENSESFVNLYFPDHRLNYLRKLSMKLYMLLIYFKKNIVFILKRKKTSLFISYLIKYSCKQAICPI